MFDNLKYRWNNRGVVCLKCGKKLVGGEKRFCHKRSNDIKGGAVGTAVAVVLGILGINHHNSKKG